MVSIIILSYNTKDLLKQCLESLFQHIPAIEAEVIVVDNASSDGSAAMVKREFKQVKVIENDKNLGFAKGCNIGASHAKGEYLLFLNSDTLLSADPLPAVIGLMKQHGKAGIVGGLLENSDGTTQRSYGEFYTLKNIFLLLFLGEQGELSRLPHTTTLQADWVSGGFLLITREAFDKVQGFNEAYFMYLEDMDLCFRVRKAGYDIWFTPKAKVLHSGHGSSSKTFAITHIYKGLQIFYKQQASTLQYYLVKGLLLLKAITALFLGVVTLNKGLVRTYTSALRTL